MSQHLIPISELPLMGFMRLMQGVVIKGEVDGQAGGPPNNEQPIVVKKKKIKKIVDYGIILPIGVPSYNYHELFGETSDKMLEHYVQQMQSEIVTSIIGSFTYSIGIKVKILRDIFTKALENAQIKKIRVLLVFGCVKSCRN